ncbi:aldo/keto reductase [Alteribacillus iranensis]|uniref:Aldo/keto reductase n=1 Tax=Alteribacillus iranensis TaxID=930128 RepID=A0A1I2DQN2_9BACI|nr:aldo/keto reductase [Alteribacillus iranensis]SFE82808.1 Aldo/keto reductase [Alteribacillus iranensis]
MSEVVLPDQTVVSQLGQGTWHMGEDPKQRAAEIRALQLGIDRGMTLIDTAEMYADGEAETVVGEAIKGRRDDVFLVSKVYPFRAGRELIEQACEQSLKRLQTDYLDLYLLHWQGNVPLSETIEGMEMLQAAGKIKRWGVSNLDISDMKELQSLRGGERCAVNQVLYHLGSRGIEYDLLPWQREAGMPIMAYCPLAQGGRHRQQLIQNPTLDKIAKNHDASPLQIALAWTMRTNDVISIPKAVQEKHVIENAEAAMIKLTETELEELDRAFPPPNRKQPLDIV